MRNWPILCHIGFPGGTGSKESTCQCKRCKRRGFDPWVRKIPWRRKWQLTPVFLPKICHRQRSLAGYSPWGYKELDMTEWLHLHFSLSCTGEGNGNPLQWSCLENPRDGGAWWTAIYGVAQSRTQLKRLSSSTNCLFESKIDSFKKQLQYCFFWTDNK